ncbi:MAG: bifunctional D-glycero-beta-D-manno-heptose-7-phosphate kinase/D-glycero-beta-D-manno-heptose 1-phosphate adenylyltransferase HldE [Coxiellaceae bacterium]|jgi:D-beta-D-heptose 7-phosphate kinase/D-beta-D-heptose 1-phosphate adenosyltransferase|nr:bifunctional D-glycero-beta-D-manno-heptose-7-phosphate kinase/D-glycero-beta-D-manno-heptose 1-phosphate adenylyltransferase HldE [Coxiellaceae bacterium]
MKMKIPNFEKAKILVVGDIMLDQYWQGDVSRISPEAPVPIIHVQRVEEQVGGAGNVALNIRSIGSVAKLLGLVGNDPAADFIERSLEQEQIAHCLLRIADVPTITKLRVIGHNQQLIRLDFEKYFKQWQEDQFLTAYLTQLAECDLVILSDYGKGTLKDSTKLIELARNMRKPVFVDPKGRDFNIYRGATLIKPNMVEFEAIVGSCHNEAEIETKGLQLLRQCEIQAILITRGAHGMSLICENKLALHLPAKSREVYDVTGAGDTVIAILGAAVATGEELFDAMVLANIAAGEVIKKLGASTISLAELTRALQRHQDSGVAILDEVHLLQQIKEARLRGEKIVMTNGCFDILHSGHVLYLERAKALGQRLIVAVNDDSSVSHLKGKGRPINKVRDRMLILAALSAVDWVVQFTEDTPERLIELISPDFLVKGGDYKIDEIVGSQYVLTNGGQVITLPFENGFSTSNILERIQNSIISRCEPGRAKRRRVVCGS